MISSKGNIISIASELELRRNTWRLWSLSIPSVLLSSECRAGATAYPYREILDAPLAENFIHGFNANHEFNLYVVNGYEAEDGYVLEFVDNGRGIPPERYVPFEAQCLIMMNLLPIVSAQRIYAPSLFYGSGFSIEIANNEEAGVSISVRISKEVIEHVQTDDCG